MHCCFAIIPDDISSESAGPVALFQSIEDAMDWGLSRYKGGSFRVRYERLMLVEPDDAKPEKRTRLLG